jgi:beta-1,4-mannosyltransferase
MSKSLCQHKAYIYPITSRGWEKTPQYIFYFIEGLKGHFEFVNRDRPSLTGILDILKYVNKIDFLFLNWPEEIPDKKKGYIQTLIFYFTVIYVKIRRIRIIYTLHNRESHSGKNPGIKNAIRKFVLRKADLIITHSKEGLDVLKEIDKNYEHKSAYFCHPILPKIDIQPGINKKYDILIWGTIEPYKGVDLFIKFINERKLFNIKILIAGKIRDESSRQKIMLNKPTNIEVIEKYISDDELKHYISQSKAVLFTYTESSILSSGVLMDSLKYAPLIIGPNIGAFRDLAQEGIIYTFSNYDELFELLSNIDSLALDKTVIDKFIESNQWPDFGKSLSDLLCSI